MNILNKLENKFKRGDIVTLANEKYVVGGPADHNLIILYPLNRVLWNKAIGRAWYDTPPVYAKAHQIQPYNGQELPI